MSVTAPSALTFRTAARDDVDAIVALVESSYRGDVSRGGWTTEADILDGRRTGAEEVEELIVREGSRIIVVQRDGDMIACAHIERQDGFAYFGMFSVRPGLQNGGVGRATLAEAERVVRDDWRLSELRMKVITLRAELIAWYERRGYRRTGEYTPFPYGDERFGIPRRDDLRFETLVKELRE